MNDPDAGHKNYQYDDNGNLLQTTDNKGQVIQYTYDALNRKLTEDYLDVNNVSPDVAYYYELPSPDYSEATNTKGQLSWEVIITQKL